MIENTFLLAQILGGLALILQLIAWQIKTPRLIILMYIPCNILWSAQFYLLGAFIGCFQAALGVIKDYLLFSLKQHQIKWVVVVYLPLILFVCIKYFENAHDILPFIGSACVNLAMLNRDNRNLMTRAALVYLCCMFFYNLFSAAYVSMIGDSIIACGIFIGMVRHEKWRVAGCYRTFIPNLHRALFNFTPRTFA